MANLDQILYILPRGFAIGALVSAPMGPIGMLVIQRTLSKGRWPAFFTGTGAALSDLVYCLLTGLCLSFITGFIDDHHFLIQIIGSAVLAAFGLYLFRKNPTRSLRAADAGAGNCWGEFASGFLLTFSNPLILFFIIGLFARFTIFQPESTLVHYIVAYAAIFAGALMWWYIVTLFVSRLQKRINVRSLKLINRLIGIILIVMAVIGIVVAATELLI